LSAALSGPAGLQTPGSDVTVQFTVGNSGPDLAQDIAVTLTLADGLSFNDSDIFGACPVSGQTAACTAAQHFTFSAGSLTTASVSVHIAADATGDYTISGSFSSATADPDLTNNLLSVTVSVSPAAAPPAPTSTTTSVTPDTNPSFAGAGVVYTVAVSSSAGTPTGSVSVVVDGGTPFSGPLDSAG